MKSLEKNIGIIFVVLVIVSLALPWLLTMPAIHSRFVFSSVDGTGQIGDTIGGTMGPFIGIIAALLTYFVFRSQTKFEERQAFESKFYKMLDYHRQNVSEMYMDVNQGSLLSEVKSVKCFEEMTKELELIYDIGAHFERQYVSTLSLEGQQDFSRKKSNLYYLTFHYGVNNDYYNEMLDHSDIESDEILNAYHGFILAIKHDFMCKDSTPLLSLASLSYFNFPRTCSKETIIPIYNSMDEYLKLKIKQATPVPILQGNLIRLNHYFVNLFNVFKLVEQEIPAQKNKLKYYSIVKSQLTAYEIILLHYNCYAPYGKKWHYHPERDEFSPNDNYITRTDLFEHLIRRPNMQDDITNDMRQDTVTELRQSSVLMAALKKSELSYFSEFYKRNRRAVKWIYAVAIILWAAGTMLFLICNKEQDLCQNALFSLLALLLLPMSLFIWMGRYVHVSSKKQEIISSYGFDPSEVLSIKQVSYLRFRKELFSMGYLTGKKEDDARLLSLYISWVAPTPKLTTIALFLAGFSSLGTILASNDLTIVLLTLAGLLLAFFLFRIIIDVSEISKWREYVVLEFLQSLYAENQISD